MKVSDGEKVSKKSKESHKVTKGKRSRSDNGETPKSHTKKAKTVRKILFNDEQNERQEVIGSGKSKNSMGENNLEQCNNNATRATRSTTRSKQQDDETAYECLVRKVKENKKCLQKDCMSSEEPQAHCSMKIDKINDQSQTLQEHAQVHRSEGDGVYVDINTEEELDYEDDVVGSEAEDSSTDKIQGDEQALVEEEQGNLASAEELDEERRIMNHPLFKNMMKKFDESLQQVQQAAVEAVKKATSSSQQLEQGTSGTPNETGKQNASRRPVKLTQRIKLPSDMTIYAPVLAKQNVNIQKSSMEVPVTEVAMCRQNVHVDEDCLIPNDISFIQQIDGMMAVQPQTSQFNTEDHQSQVHAISNFVESIRLEGQLKEKVL